MITKPNNTADLLEQVEQLKVEHEIARLRHEIREYGAQSDRDARAAEWGQKQMEIAEAALMSTLTNQFQYSDTPTDPVTRRSQYGDYMLDMPEGRDKGQDSNVFETDTELAQIRGIGRTLASMNETTVGILKNLVNYILGTGFDTEIKPKVDRDKMLEQVKLKQAEKMAQQQEAANQLAKSQPKPGEMTEAADDTEADPPAVEMPPAADKEPEGDGDQLQPVEKPDPEQERRKAIADKSNDIIDEFRKRAKWRKKQREGFVRKMRDGEVFYRITTDDDGKSVLKFIEPSWICEPTRPDQLNTEAGETLEWSFGIGTRIGDTSDVVAYYISYGRDADDWEVVPAEEIIHVKANVDDCVKRGVSDFYVAFENIERVAKIARNSGSGAAIQAAIAFIREWTTPAQPGDVSGRIGSSAGTANASNPASRGQTIRSQNFEEGSIVDTYGAKYHAGPLGTQHLPAVVQIAEAIKRHFGAVWCMPGFMLTGDASGTTSYASAFVAESPFVRNGENEQEDMVETFDAIIEKVLEAAVAVGEFKEWDIATIDELLAVIEIHTERPSIAVRERKDESEIYKALHEKRACSLRTWATKMGLDWEQEQIFQLDEPETPDTPMPPQFNVPPKNSDATDSRKPVAMTEAIEDDAPMKCPCKRCKKRRKKKKRKAKKLREAMEVDPRESLDSTSDDDNPSEQNEGDADPINDAVDDVIVDLDDSETEIDDPAPTDHDRRQMPGETVREWQERINPPQADDESDDEDDVADESPQDDPPTDDNDGDGDVVDNDEPSDDDPDNVHESIVDSIDLDDEQTRLALAAKLIWKDYP